jgi:nondiscriminating aspartyl-tRNA synthetase
MTTEDSKPIQRYLARDLGEASGREVRLQGWVHRVRLLKEVAFVILRDRSGLAQVVVPPGDLPDLPVESVVEITGRVVGNEQAPGGYEVHDAQFRVISRAVDQPPIDLYRPVINAQLPTLLDSAPVTLRHPQLRAIHQVSAASVAGFRSALIAMQFTEIFTPKIVPASTESGATVFKVDYFGRDAFLAQSPQFYKQILVGVFERVFEVAPVFRAEPSDTTRHLAEYTSLDAEMGFIKDHTTVMAMLREVVAGMAEGVREYASEAAQLLKIDIPDVPKEIPSIRFTEAMEVLSRRLGQDLTKEDDFAPQHERALGEWAREEHGSEFLYVTHYPMSKRPFYTHPSADPRYANGFDLLFRGLEMVTGGQRLHLYEDYVKALDRAGFPIEAYTGFLQAFRYGMPPHGGFGMGLGRWMMSLTGVPNMRQVTLFPRDMNRVSP